MVLHAAVQEISLESVWRQLVEPVARVLLNMQQVCSLNQSPRVQSVYCMHCIAHTSLPICQAYREARPQEEIRDAG